MLLHSPDKFIRIFDRSQTVADRLGRNEKTKVIGKLQKPGAGAPCREPGVSEEEKKVIENNNYYYLIISFHFFINSVFSSYVRKRR